MMEVNILPQVNVVVNGNFETGMLTAWFSQSATVTKAYSRAGLYSARLSSSASNSFISQFVPI